MRKVCTLGNGVASLGANLLAYRPFAEDDSQKQLEMEMIESPVVLRIPVEHLHGRRGKWARPRSATRSKSKNEISNFDFEVENVVKLNTKIPKPQNLS